MANVTLEAGYLPECSGLEPADFSADRAANVDFRQLGYYVDLLPSSVPAIVFGSLAAAGMVFYLFWMWIQHRRITRARRQRAAEAGKLQLMTPPPGPQTNILGGSKDPNHGSSGSSSSPCAVATGHPGKQGLSSKLAAWWGGVLRRSEGGIAVTWGRMFKLFIVLLSLSLVGVSGWGIAKSIQASDYTISNFWGIVDVGEDKLREAADTLQLLDDQLTNISYALGVTSSVVQDVPTLVMIIPGVKDVVKTLQSAPVAAKKAIDNVQGDLQSAIQGIEDKGLGTIANLKSNWYWWTSQLEDTWRLVVIGGKEAAAPIQPPPGSVLVLVAALLVVFGLTILFTLAAMALVVAMRWQKWASLSVAALWFCVVVLMFLGVGLLSGAYKVSEDGCLYAEAFALRVVNESITSESGRETALRAMNYYFGFLDIPDELVVDELFGAPTHTIRDIMEGSLMQTVLNVLDSGSGVLTTVLKTLGVSAEDTATILSLVDLAPATVDTVAELDRLANRANIEPVYLGFKEWVCCDLRGTLFDVWEAWTVAGCLGWVLGSVCSVRVVLHTLGIRRTPARKPQSAGGDLAPLPGPQESCMSEAVAKDLDKLPTSRAPSAALPAELGAAPAPGPGAAPAGPAAEVELTTSIV
ncbi:hypothetical protein N2152v2_007368 [Parachlorella kessleri]